MSRPFGLQVLFLRPAKLYFRIKETLFFASKSFARTQVRYAAVHALFQVKSALRDIIAAPNKPAKGNSPSDFEREPHNWAFNRADLYRTKLLIRESCSKWA